MSCITICTGYFSFGVKNCTNDTILIGQANVDCIDSVYFFLENETDTTYVSLGRINKIGRLGNLIPPDSICYADGGPIGAFNKWYLFVIKLADAKKYSWKEIRTRKLYTPLIIYSGDLKSADAVIMYKE